MPAERLGTRLTRSPSVGLLVEQAPPRFQVGPKSRSVSWESVAELAALFGKPLDPWQELVLQAAMGERYDGRWASRYVMVSAPRQNGKSLLMAARAVAGALVLGEQKIVVSAHQQDTARGIFDEIVAWQDESPALAARIAPNGIMTALNRESIKFTNGARIQFKARSGPGGRGFSCDCLLLDEAQILSERAWASINSTMSARANPQAWLLGTPPTPEDDSAVFTRMRTAALSPSPPASLAYLEWSADPADDPAGVKARESANPAWHSRINHEVVDGEYATYSPEQFARERLGIWDEESVGTRAIDAQKWAGHLGQMLPTEGPVVAVADTTVDRGLAAIVAVGAGSDGIPQVRVAHSGSGIAWVPAMIVEICTDHPEVAAVVIDERKSTEPLAEAVGKALEAAELEVEIVRTSYGDMAEASALTFDLIHEGQMRHAGDPALDAAVRSAVKDEREGAFTWSRKKAGAQAVPLVAMSLGLWEWRRRVAANYDVMDSFL